MKAPSRHVLTNVRLPRETLKSLKYRAIEERRPAAAIVREAVQAYLTRGPSGPRAKDAARWLEGFAAVAVRPAGAPRDLAAEHDHYLYGAPRRSRRTSASR